MSDDIKRRKRKPKAGTIEDARALLWQAIQKAGVMLEGELAPDMTLRLLHGLSQAVGSYARIVETSELAERVAALEAVSGGES